MPRISGLNLQKSAIILIGLLAAIACALNFMPGGAASLKLSQEEREWLSNNPEPSLGVSLHYPPYETFNLDNKYFGLTADYINIIESKTGLRFKLVRCVNTDDATAKLKSGALDVFAAVQPNSELASGALLTEPYVSVPAVIITRKEQAKDLTLNSMAGMTVGLAVSEEFSEYLLKRHPNPPFTISIPEGGYIGGLRALSVGDYDAMICDMAVSGHYIATAGISNLRVAGVTGYEVRHSFAVRADLSILSGILEKALESISTEERQSIEEHWIGLQIRPFWQTSDFRRWFLTSIGVISGVLLLGTAWIYILRRQVASRTALLSSINRVLLRSLGCRTEAEVLDGCLEEAADMTKSKSAAYGAIEGDTLRLEPGRNHCRKDSAPYSQQESITLTGEEAAALSSGQPVLMRGNYLLLPMRLEDTAVKAAFILHRPDKAFKKREAGSMMEWIFIVHEVTRRKRAERALNEKEIQLQQSQRLEAVGVFAGGIAHDFNNILGAIIANGEMLEMFHQTDDEVCKKIQAMLGAAYKGRDVVKRILHFTRRQDESKSEVKMSGLIQDTLNILEPSIPKGIDLCFCEIGDEPSFYGNGTQIHQVVMNLSVNAVQVMGSKGLLEFGVRHAAALPEESANYGVSLQPDGAVICSRGRTLEKADAGYIVLTVKDSGPGMEEAVMRQMFSPLFSTKAPGEGTGLGLTIVDSIVGMHKGYILVRSAPGRGTEFSIYFPILSAPEE